jgi:hypothetical protein
VVRGTRPGKKAFVTQNRSVQQAARKRALETGENYTTAMRATLAARGDDDAGNRARRPPAPAVNPDALRPGTVTVAISGGGAGNLGLVLPDLVRLRNAGHTVLAAKHDSGRGIVDLGSPLDFAWAGGYATIAEIRAMLAERAPDEIVRFVTRANHGIRFLARPLSMGEWRELIKEATANPGKQPVVWVQDIQTNGAIAGWPGSSRLSEYDQVPLQLSGFKELAEDTGCIVAAGHVLPDDEPGWRVVAGIATEVMVLDEESPRLSEVAKPREVELRHLNPNGDDWTTTATLDTSFWDWRDAI